MRVARPVATPLYRNSVPSVSGRQDHDNVATERSNQVDRPVDDTPTSEGDGVLRLAETRTVPCCQNDRRDDRPRQCARRYLLLGHRSLKVKTWAGGAIKTTGASIRRSLDGTEA